MSVSKKLKINLFLISILNVHQCHLVLGKYHMYNLSWKSSHLVLKPPTRAVRVNQNSKDTSRKTQNNETTLCNKSLFIDLRNRQYCLFITTALNAKYTYN